MNNKYMNESEMINAAIRELAIDNETVYIVSSETTDEYFEVVLWTEWLRYDCYIDRVTGDLLGVDTEPAEEDDVCDIEFNGVLVAMDESNVA